jgi:GMP synthase-like glutamine amidotransferase
MRPVLILQHEDECPPALVGEYLAGTPFPTVVRRLHAGDESPSEPDGYAAVIVLGGDMNVGDEDDFPFLRHERATIAAALELGVPLLGICLGAQQLAMVAGGSVYRRTAVEIGWYPIDIDEYDPLIVGYHPRMHVFQWHHCACVLPDGALLIASRAGEPQIFRVGERAWGLQFHPEVDRAVLDGWFASDPEAIDDAWPGGLKKLRKASRRELLRSSMLCGQLVGNFLSASGARDR